MSLRTELRRSGDYFFRKRSYLPLVLLPLLLLALRDAEYLEKNYGEIIEQIWDAFCLVLALLGLLLRSLTVGHASKGTSGRNTKELIADKLNTTGMYSVVRHPLYLGNFFIFISMVFEVQAVWFGIFALFSFFVYYERIMYAEEDFLRQKFGNTFNEWAKETPAFIPELKKWKRPDLPFSFRHVLNREHTTFFIITTAVPALDILADWFIDSKIEIDLIWQITFPIGLISYLVLRTLKKKTKILKVDGR